MGKNLNPLIDLTNSDTSLFRNRIRHELIPELETYVPGFRSRLDHTIDLLSADQLVLEELTKTAWGDVVDQIGLDFVRIHQKTFNHLSLGLQRRLIRKSVAYLRAGARDVDYNLVKRAIDFSMKSVNAQQADLGLGLRIAAEGDTLIISDWGAKLPKTDWPQINRSMALPIPGQVSLKDGWVLKAEIPVDWEANYEIGINYPDPFHTFIDLGVDDQILNIRPRRPGDRFHPLGMGGKSQKISDFMINQKIPQRVRDGWPLICIGDDIIWIPGYQLDHRFRITDTVQKIVQLRFLKQMDV
jgi:tRNA(Ile)-lysidine synthase